MSPQELQTLKEQLQVKKQRMMGDRIGQTATGALGGFLRGYAGKPPAEPEPAGESDLAQFLAQEQLKNITDPSRRIAAMKESAYQRQGGLPISAGDVSQVTPNTTTVSDYNIAQRALPQESIEQPPTQDMLGAEYTGVSDPTAVDVIDVQPIQSNEKLNVEPKAEPQIEGMPEQYQTVEVWKTNDLGVSFKVKETKVNPFFTEWLERQQFLTQEQQKILNKGLAEREQNMRNYKAVEALMQNQVAVWKAAAQEKQNIPSIGPSQILKPMVGPTTEAFSVEGFPFSKSYIGQRIETAMALSKIITGGSRIIKSVINQLMKTLPVDNGIMPDMQSKIYQSVTNAYSRALGRPLRPEERQQITQSIVDNVLSVEPSSDTLSNALSQLPTSKRFTVDGVEYNIPIQEVENFFQSMPDDAVIISLD